VFDQLPQNAETLFDWTWDDYAPYYDALLERELTAETVAGWLADYSRISALVVETEVLLYTAKAANTADETAKNRFFALLDVMEKIESAANKLQQKLLDSGLEPEGFEIPLREMRGDVNLFREENLPLSTALQKLGDRYEEISGAQTVN
jgi:oligoendopeptidase F